MYPPVACCQSVAERHPSLTMWIPIWLVHLRVFSVMGTFSTSSTPSSSTFLLPDMCDDQGVRSSPPSCPRRTGLLAGASELSSAVTSSGSGLPAHPDDQVGETLQNGTDAAAFRAMTPPDLMDNTCTGHETRTRSRSPPAPPAQGYHFEEHITTSASGSESTSSSPGSPTKLSWLSTTKTRTRAATLTLTLTLLWSIGGATPPASTIDDLLQRTLNAVQGLQVPSYGAGLAAIGGPC